MRLIPALAALGALVRGIFRRPPRKAVIETPLADLPARGHSTRRALRRARRARILRSYTRRLLWAGVRARYRERYAIGGAVDDRRLMRSARKRERRAS